MYGYASSMIGPLLKLNMDRQLGGGVKGAANGVKTGAMAGAIPGLGGLYITQAAAHMGAAGRLQAQAIGNIGGGGLSVGGNKGGKAF